MHGAFVGGSQWIVLGRLWILLGVPKRVLGERKDFSKPEGETLGDAFR